MAETQLPRTTTKTATKLLILLQKRGATRGYFSKFVGKINLFEQN
jgi:hypothetical protein